MPKGNNQDHQNDDNINANSSLIPVDGAQTGLLIEDVSGAIEEYLNERTITDSAANISSCDAAVEWNRPIMNKLLGINEEDLIVEYKTLWWQKLQFPEDIIIKGRNISVNYYWDWSIRLETVDAINNLPSDDGFWGNSTRLEKSGLSVTLDGIIYMNPVVILDGNWWMQVTLAWSNLNIVWFNSWSM